jgi:hypothetical protein
VAGGDRVGDVADGGGQGGGGAPLGGGQGVDVTRPEHRTINDLVPAEVVPIESLTPHPRNYREHPEDQIEHLIASLQQYGQFRNVVVARDGTILAGHGVVEAAWRADWTTIEVRRLDLDAGSPEALKILTLDNELGRFAQDDDRALSELLKQIHDDAVGGLVGTGYDEMMLANLVMVTRAANEIGDFNEAAEWVGMPEFEPKFREPGVTIYCDDEAAREELVAKFDLHIGKRFQSSRMWVTFWPPREENREDVKSVIFDDE